MVESMLSNSRMSANRVRAASRPRVRSSTITPDRLPFVLTKVLIANRGEIAVRVIRTCRELGIATVAVYSDLDRDALHVRLADEAYALGGQTAAESYLNTEAILDVIARRGADGVHPGLRVLLARTPTSPGPSPAEGVTFIGPPPEAIEVMGDKISSRIAAQKAGVAGVPGTTEVIASPDEVVAFGEEYGWPVAIKAAYGGGGRGMRVVQQAGRGGRRPSSRPSARPRRRFGRVGELPRALPDLAPPRRDAGLRRQPRQLRLARQARLLGPAPPPEADRGGPAPDFPDEIRQAMGEAAVKVAKACGYVNAGTVEFLYQDGEFFFLEMNTRLQVEHPVTELVVGHRPGRARSCGSRRGEPLPFTQDEIAHRGHAIEVRINAEDPAEGRFLPSPGTHHPVPPGRRLRRPHRRRLRRRATPSASSTTTWSAKLIVWGADREHARRRMLRALRETEIEGVATTIPADIAILEHPDFIAVEHSTKWVEDTLDLSERGRPGRARPPAGASDEADRRRARRRRRGRRPALPGQAVGARRRPGHGRRRSAGGGRAAATARPRPAAGAPRRRGGRQRHASPCPCRARSSRCWSPWATPSRSVRPSACSRP